MAPMVHWPEVMVTYDSTDKILFSADAFGTYGTLDGGVIDSERNVEHYWEEMLRYYSNIVGKYGNPVQRALQKLSALDIRTICSTHGPVWREYAAKAIDIYAVSYTHLLLIGVIHYLVIVQVDTILIIQITVGVTI